MTSSDGFPKRIKLYREVKWWLLGAPAVGLGAWFTAFMGDAFHAAQFSRYDGLFVIGWVFGGVITGIGGLALLISTCASLDERYQLAAQGNRFGRWFANDDK